MVLRAGGTQLAAPAPGGRARRVVAAVPTWVLSVAVVLAGFGVWELLARTTFLGLRWWTFLVAPSRAVTAMVEMTLEGSLLVDVGYSLMRIVLGFVPGALLATVVGLAVGWNRTTGAIVEPILNLVRPFPKPTLLPVLIVLFGVGEISKTLLIAFGVFFIVVFNAMYGARGVDRVLVASFRTIGASRRWIFWHVVLPTASPYVAAGWRLGLGLSFTYMVFAELVSARDGLGHLVQSGQTTFNYPSMFAGIFTIMLLGGASVLGFMALERRALSWYHATRGRAT